VTLSSLARAVVKRVRQPTSDNTKYAPGKGWTVDLRLYERPEDSPYTPAYAEGAARLKT